MTTWEQNLIGSETNGRNTKARGHKKGGDAGRAQGKLRQREKRFH